MKSFHDFLSGMLPDRHENNEMKFLDGIRADLHDKFGIEHTTIQIGNITEGHDCEQADCN